MVLEKSATQTRSVYTESSKDRYLLRCLVRPVNRMAMPKRAAPGIRFDPRHCMSYSFCNRLVGSYRHLPVSALEVGL
jgi:hypothetical protein